ncbi:membrane-associated tyrosine- and threonine-specific cdc2-inhibitory kinase isoform 4 [Mus musculus]|uniref:membrane-associated tyrosine- and threonine-specific cdc2-inhibitory kinase isoform 4 n=1 Tax=Mus musculus TaxID=10090 RepID=UPI0023E0215B|nr:membrane-associated tyrosine- and threonine-specific cdc2-inhibitory kinase isoform 4 [Mus musculus]
MTMPTEGTPPPLSGTPIPVPAYFRHAEPGFSLKRPGGLSRSLPPRPPAKGCIPVSRLFPPRTPGWHQPQPRRVSFLCETSEPLQSPGYDPSRPESFFQQNFQRLSRLGHGSYGEVFKVRSKEDGRLYAVKRYMSPFRGPKDRTRKLAEPANIFLGPRGRCKLGDFGLLVELGSAGAGEAQEGDPRYMAPELLQGSYGTAADVFSLGLTILEVACNMELPHGGEGWQQLRQGYLPPEFTAGLSSELRSVLAMMLEPDPQLRATAEALLALPMLRQPRPWNVLWYMAAEALSRGWALWQALVTLLCWLWHGLVHPASWLQPPGPPATPPGSPPCSPLLDSTLSSSWDNDSIGPSLSPETVLSRITRRTSTPRGRYIPRDALDLTDVDSEPPRGPCPTFEPRNLLSLFEDSLDPA